MKKILIKLSVSFSVIVLSFGVVFLLAISDKTPAFIDLEKPTSSFSYYKDTPQQTKKNTDQECFVLNENTQFSQQTNTEHKFNSVSSVTDGATHQILDKGFNQSAYQGIADWVWTDDWYENQSTQPVALKEPSSTFNPNNRGSAQASKTSSDNTMDFWLTYESLINKHINTLVLPGFMHNSGLSAFKQKSFDIYKKAGYMLFDTEIDDDPNVASVSFRIDEASFLIAVATCQYLNENFAEYGADGLNVGFFGGVPLSSIIIYFGGFEYGIKFWNENIEYIAEMNEWSNPEEHKVNIINLGKFSSFFSNSFSIGDGKPLAQSLLSRGADAIFPVAGPQVIDAVKEIKNQHSNCIVVGTDVEQEYDDTTNEISPYTDTRGDNKIIKFSVLKNITSLTSQMLSLAFAGMQISADGKVGLFGWLTVGEVDNHGVAPSHGSYEYLLDFLELFISFERNSIINILDFIIDKFENFGPENINFFDQNHLSKEENMCFTI